MKLSELKEAAQLEVLRDGEFLSVGLLSHNAEKMLVGLYDPAYRDLLLSNQRIACVITKPEYAEGFPERLGIAVCDDPLTAFYRAHFYLFSETDFYWEDFESEISPEARVHERAYLAPKNVQIGAGTIVEPNASIMERAIIGKNVTIRAGAVIAGEDLEAKRLGRDYPVIPHAGAVLIEDGTEVQGGAQIMRAVYGGFTVVGEECRIGAMVHLAHNVTLGRRCYVAPCTIVCGSARLEDDVWVGPSSTISSELTVGRNAVITLGSVVTKDVPQNGHVSGNFAIEHSRFIDFIRKIR